MFSFRFSKSDKTAAATPAVAAHEAVPPPPAAAAVPDERVQQLLDAVLNSGILLPSPTLAELQQVAADEDSGPREITAVVEKDPGMVGAILRVVNSPVFRTRTPPATVFEAVTRLGRTKTVAIASSESLRAQCGDIDPLAVERLWGASARTAEWAYWIATHSRLRGIADIVYLAAVLHDVGVILPLRRQPEYAALYHRSDLDADAASLELDALSGIPHAIAGAHILRNWKLPEPVIEAVRMHHALGAEATPVARRMACLIAAAHWLENGDDGHWTAWAEAVRRELGLDEPALQALAAARSASEP